MMGKAREHAFQDLMVEPLKRQPAAPLVRDGEDAIDIGKSRRQAPSRNLSATYRDVLAEQLTVLTTAM